MDPSPPSLNPICLSFHSLPPEIIARIFWHCSPPWSLHTPSRISGGPDNVPSTFIIGAVCRTWREIAWGTPMLWSSIRIHVTPERIATQIVLLEEWLCRSGSLPLDIMLSSEDNAEWPEGHDPDPQVLLTIANRYADRWRSLVLQVPGDRLEALPSPETPLPLLTALKVDPPFGQITRSNQITLRGASELKEAVLNSVYIESVDIPLAKITNMTLNHCFVDECLHMLAHCPLLTHAKFKRLSPDPSQTVTLAQNATTLPLFLPSLQSLEIKDISSFEGARLLGSITAPGLTVLVFHGRMACADAMDDFLSRGSTELRDFYLSCEFLSVPDLNTILRHMKTVRTFELSVSDNAAIGSPFQDRLLDRLRASRDTTGQYFEAQGVLPELEELKYTGPQNFTWPPFIAAWKARCRNDVPGSTEKVDMPKENKWVIWLTTRDRDIPPTKNDTFKELEELQAAAGGRLTLHFPPGA